MAPRLHLPPRVVRAGRERQRADIDNAMRTVVCREFDADLKRIDPALELIWWPETAPRTPGFVGGRYHIIRHPVDGGMALVEAFVDELGGYREPDSSLFTWLERSDLWNDRVRADRERARQRAIDAAAAAERREDEDRQEEIRDRVNAATRAFVSMDRSVPWTQTATASRPKSKLILP